MGRAVVASLVLLSAVCAAHADEPDASRADTRALPPLDIRDDETRLKWQDGNFVAVPIPMSNPTLDTGLIGGAAYFYPQSEAQKRQQPASVTAVGAMYTSNDSRALGLFQQNYWRDDRWRFTGAAGAADVRLSLITPEEEGGDEAVDWQIEGAFAYAGLSRRLRGDWYGGALLRYIDAEQDIEQTGAADAEPLDNFDTGRDVRAAGLGLTLEYDSRDLPTGPGSGRHFKAEGVFNDTALGSEHTYQTYSLAYRSYHRMHERLILAWVLEGCQKDGRVPLWDACRIPLRGFSAFDYLGMSSLAGQLEGRWRVHERWGAVVFAGSGWAGRAFSESGRDETIPSYGFGLRYEILPEKRLNLRVDFAWSEGSDGVYLAVGEAF